MKHFELLADNIVNNCFTITSILKSRDCSSVKGAIETLVGGFINRNEKFKKKQLTFPVLEAWFRCNYKDSNEKPKLVMMLADFEQFNPLILQKLIEIFISYTHRLPIVLILGVATAFKAVHNVLPFHITSKINAHIFQAESSSSMLNRILNEVILTHHSSFFLSGKSFKILMDIFLFYDYSLSSFMQGFKYFMLEQFSTNIGNSIYVSQGEYLTGRIENLTHEECEEIRRTCPSFRKFVESEQDPQKRIGLITNDVYFKSNLIHGLSVIYRHFCLFFCGLRMLAILIEDLPRNNLGKLPRELYPLCAASEITKLEEYQECLKLLRFSSKDKFLAKLDKILDVLRTYEKDESFSCIKSIRKIIIKVNDFKDGIAAAGMSPVKQNEEKSPKIKQTLEINRKGVLGRQQMLEELKASAKTNTSRVIIEFEKQLCDCIDYLNNIFEKNLKPFNKFPVFSELIIFSDCNSIRRQIVGTPRASIHSALSNPHQYLQCKCCVMKEDERILSTLPDLSIAYKLHLECNKFINLYDWLQAFAMVIENNDEDSDEISPEIQARFTRATAELQFLGLIKQAKHKTDHVMRLTW